MTQYQIFVRFGILLWLVTFSLAKEVESMVFLYYVELVHHFRLYCSSRKRGGLARHICP